MYGLVGLVFLVAAIICGALAPWIATDITPAGALGIDAGIFVVAAVGFAMAEDW